MKTSQLPDFSYEKKLWREGFRVVAGVDEVGRGCFAGPVVAAAVAFAPMANAKWQMLSGIRIDDSKKLTPGQREGAEGWIKENALTWGIGEASVATINRLGMAKATKMAFRRAIAQAQERLRYKDTNNILISQYPSIEYLLVDAFFIPNVPNLPTRRRKDKKGRYWKNPKGRQLAIINGDEISASIAAASIIAKVYRDKLMTNLSKQSNYKKYGWEKNKGYGTKEHQEAIKKYGITRLHRKQFVETFLNTFSSSPVQ